MRAEVSGQPGGTARRPSGGLLGPVLRHGAEDRHAEEIRDQMSEKLDIPGDNAMVVMNLEGGTK